MRADADFFYPPVEETNIEKDGVKNNCTSSLFFYTFSPLEFATQF